MKKALIIIITLLLIPYAVFAEMTVLDNSKLDSITGQIGMTIGIAPGDLDIEANVNGNLSAIFGVVGVSGNTNIALTNEVGGDIGQYINIEFLPETIDSVSGNINLIEVRADLSGINIAGGLSDTGLNIFGASVVNGNLAYDVSLNKCIVSVNIH